jgi:hypothetical protein
MFSRRQNLSLSLSPLFVCSGCVCLFPALWSLGKIKKNPLEKAARHTMNAERERETEL